MRRTKFHRIAARAVARLGLFFLVAVTIFVLCPVTLTGTDEPTLSKDQIKQFLLTAKVIRSRPANKGITSTFRLTLSDGTLTHDAHFQPVDEHKSIMKFSDGRTEMNFVDSYKNNLAAYALAVVAARLTLCSGDCFRRRVVNAERQY